MRFGSVERESKNCFNSDRQHLQTFQDKQKNQYYYTAVDKNSFNNNNNNSNIKSYAIGGHNQQQHHQHINSATKAMTQSSSSFYHLACIAPEDLPKDRSQAAAGVRLGCHGDEEGEDDDNEDDFVLEFLEAYRKAPEVTKFQAKVYLELWKEPLRPPHSSTFLCPDDSKKFITIHDFPSPSNQVNAANNSNNNINKNINNNSNNTNNNNNNNSSNDHSNCYPFCIHQSPDDWKVQHQHSRINHHSTNRLDIASPRNLITSTPPVACRSSSSVGGCRNVTSSSTDRTTYAKTYAFDRIFMPEDTMMDVYIESVTSVLKAVLSGHNGCISCYGEPDDIDDSGRGSLAGATLRWLYALLEESSHDSLSTYSIKVSAVEFIGTGDSVRDLLLDFGTMKMKAREAGEEQQSRYIRVASCKDACQVLTKALEARSASSVNVIFTVHLRQYQARVPSHGKVISLSNQLHIINISDRQKEVSLKGMNKSHPQARDGPFASLAGRDNLMQYIGSLMIGQRSPMSSLSRLHSLLQNCILPSNVQCQSCLVIRLGKVQTPVRDVQKLLNLGTKIYKRRFSKNKHLRNTGVQSFYPMNSSASETSSCASSGFSNLRKSRVRMGTQQWQRKVDPVPAHCSVAKSAHPYEVVPTNFDRSTPLPSRPNYLNLECKFVPQSGSDQHLATSRTMSPPPLPSPFKGHWKSLAGRVLQDTIMEQPEDKWETNGTPNVQEGSSNRHETWIDGPACMLSNPYANLGHKTGAHFARDAPADRNSPTKPVFNGLGNPSHPGRPNQIRSYRTTGSSQFFQSSIRSLTRTGDSFNSTKTFQTDLSNQRHFASRIHLNPGGIRPSNSFESSERLVPNTCPMPDHTERSLLPLNSFKFHQSSISSRSNLNERFPDPVGNFVDETFVRQGIRKSSLPNSITAPVLWGREPTGTVANKFGSSSIYESWFEDKVESGSSNLLTDSFTANQSEPLGTFRSVAETDASRNNNNRSRTTTTTTVATSLARDPKSSPQQDTYEPIRKESESDSYSNKNTKEKKFQLFKRFRRLFTRNPFKHASSSSALNAVSRPNKDGSLAETSGGSLTHNSDLIGSPYLKSQKKSNSNLDDGFKKHFSFFARRRGSSQKVDLIATAPTTPNIYYDNQAAVATIASTSSASMFNFPVKPNAEDMAFHRLPFGGPGMTKGSSNVDLGQDSCRSGVQLLPRGQRRGGFFAFIDDDDDDGASQVESSVANVVCYRKIAFPKRVSDHGARPDNPFLTPSYYRFSKLSSDGEQFSNNNSNNNSSDPDNNSNNNNNNNNNNSNNNRSSSSYEPNSCDDDDDGVSNHDNDGVSNHDDDDVASDDYVVIKMTDANASDLELELNKKVIEVSSSSSSSSPSSSSFVKNVSMDSDHQDRHDGDDNDAGDDDAEKTIGESLVPTRDADHQTYVLRKRSRFSGFISRGKQLMNRKPTKRERCVMQ